MSEDETGSSGRLERQTNDGVVAIKELRGDSCGEVADALALTLALADEQRATSHEPEPASEPEPEPERTESASTDTRCEKRSTPQ